MISPKQISSDGYLQTTALKTTLILAVFGWLADFGGVIPDIPGTCRVNDAPTATATLSDSTNASISDRANGTAEISDALEV